MKTSKTATKLFEKGQIQFLPLFSFNCNQYLDLLIKNQLINLLKGLEHLTKIYFIENIEFQVANIKSTGSIEQIIEQMEKEKLVFTGKPAPIGVILNEKYYLSMREATKSLGNKFSQASKISRKISACKKNWEKLKIIPTCRKASKEENDLKCYISKYYNMDKLPELLNP